MMKATKAALACAAILQVTGCAAEMGGETNGEGVENVATDKEAIRNGWDVPAGHTWGKSTVQVGNTCTGTIIGQKYVLTSANCFYTPGKFSVKFYSGAVQTGDVAQIFRAYLPFGVTKTDGIDENGKWAGYAVLMLQTPIPAGNVPAPLATRWIGSEQSMTMVGRGRHDGISNPTNLLRYRQTLTYSASNANGHILTEAAFDDGDHGGPIYAYGNVVDGVAYQNVFEWATRGMYISTAFHFWNIVKAAGLTKEANVNYSGSDYAQFENQNWEECAARCLADTECKAYTLTTVVPNGKTDPIRGRCYLKDAVPTPTTGSGGQGRFSGVKKTTPCVANGDYCGI